MTKKEAKIVLGIIVAILLAGIFFLSYDKSELGGHASYGGSATYEVQDYNVCGGTLDCTLQTPPDYDTCENGIYQLCEWAGSCDGDPDCSGFGDDASCEDAYFGGAGTCEWYDEECHPAYDCGSIEGGMLNDEPDDCNWVTGCSFSGGCSNGWDAECSNYNDDQSNCEDHADLGCTWDTCTDSDGDNYSPDGGDCGTVDCNDSNASINPGATEVCNGIDDNCNGLIDGDDGIVCAVCGDNVTEGAEDCDGEVCCDVDCTFLDSSNMCRDSAGDCDAADYCSGSSATCSDSFKDSSNVCRASAGDCDVVENCTGSSVDCPADAVKGSSVVCRASTGNCDPEETCDGSNVDCPADVDDYCTFNVCVGTKDCASTSESHCISPACIWEEVAGTDPCTGGPQCDGNPMDLAIDPCEGVSGCTWVYQCTGDPCGDALDQSTCENPPYSTNALCEWYSNPETSYCRADRGCGAFDEEAGECPAICTEEYGISSECSNVTDASCSDITNETNCEGVVGCSLQECEDLDDDGYGSEGGDCGTVDCDDSDADVNPGATEVCNDIDDDCDGEIDEGGVCPTDTTTGPLSLPVSESDLGKGYEKALGENWQVSFSFKGTRHSVTVSRIAGNQVTVVVQSEEQIVDILEGETKKVDLDNDGFYDLQVYLKSIVSGKANLIFTTISEEIPKESPASEEGESIGEAGEEPSYMIPIIVVALVIIAAIVYGVLAKGKAKKRKAIQKEKRKTKKKRK